MLKEEWPGNDRLSNVISHEWTGNYKLSTVILQEWTGNYMSHDVTLQEWNYHSINVYYLTVVFVLWSTDGNW